MIDTHCHLTFPDFEGRVADVLRDARQVGVHSAITISTTTADATRTVALARQHERLFASAGVHPLYAAESRDWEEMRAAGTDPKCVAWGELGLDRHYKEPPQPMQQAVLEEQLAKIVEWRREGLAKPIILHCREAHEALIQVLAATDLPRNRFVFHCFTGDESDMRRVLDFGAHVSFTGVLTYANAAEVRRAAALAPLDRVMVETDSPFLAPLPHRGVWPNEPKHVIHVAAALAAIHGITPAALEERLDANAAAFFGPALTARA